MHVFAENKQRKALDKREKILSVCKPMQWEVGLKNYRVVAPACKRVHP